MNIHEYQAKEILAKHGVAVPKGVVVDNPEKAETAAPSWEQMLSWLER